MQTAINQPFTNVQLELLKTFAHRIPDSDLLELRKVMAHFFAQRAIAEADKVWEENNWSDDYVDTLLNTKMRKEKR